MGFVTPALLGGAALVAIPIVLHLAMRRRPREVVFPALRFVQQRREANRRRVQFRHLLLLALRCLLIVAVAAALARPTLKGQGLRGKEGDPLAVAMVFDNSLRTQYVRQNRTRLEEAVEIAAKLIAKLPEDAAVAVAELGHGVSGFAPDQSTAEARIDNLRPAAGARPLGDVIVDAINLTSEREDHRQEVIVFTDFAKSALSSEAATEINEAMEAAPDARIYLVDIGVEDPRQAYLGEVKLGRGLLREGEPLNVETEVHVQDGTTSIVAELFLDSGEGEPEKRGERLVNLSAVGVGTAAFEATDLPLGVHQGYVRLRAADPLAIDNTRYFTTEVRPSARILLLAREQQDAVMVREALEALGRSFACTTQLFAQAPSVEWDAFDAVLLLDPPLLSAEAWDAVAQFANSGGGVGVFLGHNASSKAFNEAGPQELLPGPLKRISREPTYLRPKRLDHPALSGLRNVSEGIPWQRCNVWAFWQFDADALREDAYVIAEFANDEPAIIEVPAGRGRVITVTTPFSDPASPEGRDPWNRLPSMPWPFVGLCDQIASYLAQDREHQLNYMVGQTATIPLGARERLTNYVLRMPDGQAYPRVGAGDEVLSLSTTDALGNYRVTAGGGRVDRGFSVNTPIEMSDLTRVDPADVIAALPASRAELADDLADAERLIDVGRAGRELYGWAIVLAAVVWGAEHVLANRFYRQAK